MNYFLHIKLEDIILGKTELSESAKGLLDGFEIVITEPYFLDFVNEDPAEFRKVEKFLDGKKVSVHLSFYDLNLGSPDRRICEHSFNSIISGLVFAQRVGAKNAVSHLGYNIKLSKNSTEKWFRLFADAKERIENFAVKKGVTVVWENTYETDFYLFDKMMELHPGTSFCLDVGHCNCFAGFSAVEFFNRYSKNIKHFHIHDNNGTEDSHVAPGLGNIDFTQIVDIIGKSSADTAIFELEFDRFERSAEYIKKLFGL
mgnify:CR=1 FL=1